MREVDDDGHFFLNQRTVLGMLQNIWGNCAVDLTPHPNDRLRLFGIVFGEPSFRPQLQRLCEGVTSRDSLDNPGLSIKQIFVELTLSFNNDDVLVTVPQDAYDLDNIDSLNPNDERRISIMRDRK